MLNLLLIVLILHYVGFFIFKNNKNISCGLFGFAGEDPKDFNRDKFDKLGIYNITRGKHSCGISVDGKVMKGIRTNANYLDFIVNKTYSSPKDIPVVIGHTRHATFGSHTLKNAHPFKIINEDDPRKYVIGAHNGTLENHMDLARKYGVDPVNKIDSEVLIEIIAKNDEPEVLKEYTGAAALLLYSSVRPNTLFVFRGESSKTEYSVNTFEERPLFYYQQNENSMYISSLEDSLKSIMDEPEDEDKIFEFRTNILYEIVNGKIVNRFKVDRKKAWERAKEFKYSNIHNKNTNTNKKSPQNSKRGRQISGQSNRSIDLRNKEKENNIHYEKIIHTELDQTIYYENLRYKRNGHLYTGICIFMKELGFVPLCDRMQDIKKSIDNFSHYDRSLGENIIPDIPKGVKAYYIFNGVLLKTKEDYLAAKSIWKNGNYTDFSHMSEYPIIDYSKHKKRNSELILANSQKIILSNQLYTGLIEPLGSYNEYEVKDGNLIEKIELDDMILPEDSSTICSLYNGIEDEDENDDPGTFEQAITDEIISIDDAKVVDSIIEVGTQLDEAFKAAAMLEEFTDDSFLVQSMLEFVQNSEKSFKPIADSINNLQFTKNQFEKK